MSEGLRQALEPSAETKAAYSGEITYSYVEIDEFGDERTVRRLLEWTTIKEVMAMIRARAALSDVHAAPLAIDGEDLVERVARAICIAEEHDPDGPHPEDAAEGRTDGFALHVFYANAARAAIATTLPDGWVAVPVEPTEAMIDRFVSRALCVSVHGDGGWSNYARGQWHAMIAASPSPECGEGE